MCGLAGIISLSSSNFDIKDTLNLMSEEILRRGPDSFGYYFDRIKLNNISIAHRRLSIIDLSEKGSQPIESKNGRYVMAFNGEIYNHKWIKRKIDNIKRRRKLVKDIIFDLIALLLLLQHLYISIKV